MLLWYTSAVAALTQLPAWELPYAAGVAIRKKKTAGKEGNEMMTFAATWIDLEMAILSEVSQSKKDKYHMISLISGI